MPSASLTTAKTKRISLFIFSLFIYGFTTAQENSPYSRYGIGDVVPKQNMVSRSMGGIATGFIDSISTYPYSNAERTVSTSSINVSNPAALASLGSTTFDIGGDITSRTLKSNTTADKYTSTNTNISYFELGFPISSKRMVAKRQFWDVAFGLRPITRVNYKIAANSRLTGIDSVTTLYEGSGGVNQFNISTAYKIKNLSFGVSSGYSFGNKTTSTKLGFNNDSVKYQSANSQVQTEVGGFFVDLGLQYAIRLQNKATLRFGVSANLQQNLKARRDAVNETFDYGSSGQVIALDTVSFSKSAKGTLVLPASYSAGFTYTNEHWLFGADVDFAQWSKFKFYDETDAVQNSVDFHAGAQYYPAALNTPSTKYWSFVRYRAGAYFGTDYIKLGSSRPDYGFTFGAGLPLTSFRQLAFGDPRYVVFNAGAEIAANGNSSNQSLRENIFRLNFGFAMSTAWFLKRKYN